MYFTSKQLCRANQPGDLGEVFEEASPLLFTHSALETPLSGLPVRSAPLEPSPALRREGPEAQPAVVCTAPARDPAPSGHQLERAGEGRAVRRQEIAQPVLRQLPELRQDVEDGELRATYAHVLELRLIRLGDGARRTSQA